MSLKKSEFKNYCSILKEKIIPVLNRGVNVFERKEDGSLVTDMDLAIHEVAKECLKDHVLLSEEEKFDPGLLEKACFVLDPIDGTNGLESQSYESTISLAYLNPFGESFGWIFQPFSGLERFSFVDFNRPYPRKAGKRFKGLISVREISMVPPVDEKKFIWMPQGSIAFKLMLLSSYVADFVVSYRTKSLWDIAAGHLMVQQMGMKGYDQNLSEISLDQVTYNFPILWCSKESLGELGKLIENGKV